MSLILDSKWSVFIKVAQLGSLSKSANAFNVPQSMISRHIAQLEEQCGARLFKRTGRGVILTELGMQLYPRIVQLSEQAAVLEDDILTFGGEPMGEVRVGLLPSLVGQLAGTLYEYVRLHYPKIDLHLSDGSNVQLEEMIADGRIDMGVLLREGGMDAQKEAVLADFGLMLVGPKHDAHLQKATIALQDIQGLPLIVPCRPHPLRARLDQLSRTFDYQFDCVVEADSNRLQHEIVAAGGGYAISSGLFRTESQLELSAALITDPPLQRSIVLSHTIRRPHTRASRVIQQWLEKKAPPILHNMLNNR